MLDVKIVLKSFEKTLIEMFESSKDPRVFALPLGCDFSINLVNGIKQRLKYAPAEALAKVEIFVNTRRIERRLKELFLDSTACLLPRIRLITDLANDPIAPVKLPKSISNLRRYLQLGRLVNALIKHDPTLAPKSAIYDLADALAILMDEMQDEAVPFSALKKIQLDNQSEHWHRNLKFLGIISEYWAENTLTDPNDRQRKIVQAYVDHWQVSPPSHPIIIAGSTGSRGATALLMKAVANLPQGAVVLPGFDIDAPEFMWSTLLKPGTLLDHPQAGLAKLLASFGVPVESVPLWCKVQPFSPERNALVSLALRPAPITDQWRNEGKFLVPSLLKATKNIDMIEANSTKEEALAIAIRLRKAVEDKQRATLISPDRNLTRRVEAMLKRWGIIADDSAGQPLLLTPSGIFLNLIANMMGQEITPQDLLTLLKHPLTNSSPNMRGDHLRRTRKIELKCLRGFSPFVDFLSLTNWAKKQSNDPEAVPWVMWLKTVISPLIPVKELSLENWMSLFFDTVQMLSDGHGEKKAGKIWDNDAGREALLICNELRSEAAFGGNMTDVEFRALLRLLLSKGEIRSSYKSHPLISIWGTLEARVQGADLVIMGSLNEGVWPNLPKPDPWLNRAMRKQIGLTLPERQIGLSAHDFQQAISANHVVLSRSLRDSETPTIASRWIIRLSNLLNGLGDDAKKMHKDMLDRGNYWILLARELDTTDQIIPREMRPSPIPPTSARLKKLSVTQVKTLIRDPYAIYARQILNLKKLHPIGREPDALARGIIIHDFLEKFITSTIDNPQNRSAEYFITLAKEFFEQEVPWPANRYLWLARLTQIAQWFVTGEILRHEKGRVFAQERKGEIYLPDLDFTLTVKADRLDIDQSGNISIFDYKSGLAPSPGVIKYFDKQLQLEAAIAQKGGFDNIGKSKVVHLEYLSLHRSKVNREVSLEDSSIDQIWEEFCMLIKAYHSSNKGYTARDKLQLTKDVSDYDHLSRKGEWEDNEEPDPQVVP